MVKGWVEVSMYEVKEEDKTKYTQCADWLKILLFRQSAFTTTCSHGAFLCLVA
jgi:hypothetical protein